MMQLGDRVVIVTGSTSGIGEEIARRFVRAGAKVVLNSATSVERGEALATELGCVYQQADVSDPVQCKALVQRALDEFGGVDVLVNNAGTTSLIPHHDLHAATPEVWRRIFDINVIGAWNMATASAETLNASGSGVVINVSSVAGIRAFGSSIPYAASKAALNHVTRLLAKTLGPGVRANAVAPGLIDSEWTADWHEAKESVRRTAPLGRVGTRTDVADAVLALTQCEYITGAVLPVDGGLHLAV